jgi:hypothetical protein
MRRPSTLDGRGPIATSGLRPDTSRPDRAIRKHNDGLRRSIWTRRHDRTRIGRRGGGSQRNSCTDARRRYIRLVFMYRTGDTAHLLVIHLVSYASHRSRAVSLARPPAKHSRNTLTPLSFCRHLTLSAATALASRPRTSNLRLAQPHGLDGTTVASISLKRW